MNSKIILFIIYSVLIFYLGYLLNDIKSTRKSDFTEIVRDTLIFQKWEKEKSNIKMKNKKPKIIKHQKLDSIKIKQIEKDRNIIEIKKEKEMINVLSLYNSEFLQTTFSSFSDSYKIISENGQVKLYEIENLLSFKDPMISVGAKYDFSKNKKNIYFEISEGIKILKYLDLDLKINTLPELSILLNYTLK